MLTGGATVELPAIGSGLGITSPMMKKPPRDKQSKMIIASEIIMTGFAHIFSRNK
jgi:hypothetical protein